MRSCKRPGILEEQTLGKGRLCSMGEEGKPPGDECLGGGLAEGSWRGSASTFGRQPDELCRFLAPTTPNFKCHNHEFASAPSLEFRVGSCHFFLFPAIKTAACRKKESKTPSQGTTIR